MAKTSYYDQMEGWFSADQASYNSTRNSSFEWPLSSLQQSAVPANPTSRPGARGQQSYEEAISMTFVKPGPLVAEVGSWFKHAQVLKSGQRGWRADNKELRPAVFPMRSDEQLFSTDHSFGPCWAMAVSSRMEFTRRTTVRDHVRLVPWHKGFLLAGEKPGNKIYAYHAIAQVAALANEWDRLNSRPPSFPDLSYSLVELQAVTKGKRATSMVICHGCGNSFCVNPFHLKIASKQENDDEEKCHHFLRRMTTPHRYKMFQSEICALLHANPCGACWTNVYAYAELDARRMSMSILPQEEAEEIRVALESGEDLGQDPSIV